MEIQKILRAFSELRGKYTDIETAIEMVCVSAGLDRQEVINAITSAGVFVPPDSDEENNIKCFIGSVDKNKTTTNELIRTVGFRFCISMREAKRLVEKMA